MNSTRPAAVAGYFYPAEREQLAADVRSLLNLAAPPHAAHPPKALIVPHAGYVYSGPTAAYAYRLLEPWREQIRRVILLGPSHRTPLRGMALPDSEAFSTPLGEVQLDLPLCKELAHMPQIHIMPASHISEHSLEVQLPFLQTVLKSFKLVPLVVGISSPQEVADVLDFCCGGPETLIVISSDLSHYLPYDQARIRDASTLEHILANDEHIGEYDACGSAPIRGLLHLARELELKAELLDYRNSGDTAGDKSRVVGYAAIAFTEPA